MENHGIILYLIGCFLSFGVGALFISFLERVLEVELLEEKSDTVIFVCAVLSLLSWASLIAYFILAAIVYLVNFLANNID